MGTQGRTLYSVKYHDTVGDIGFELGLRRRKGGSSLRRRLDTREVGAGWEGEVMKDDPKKLVGRGKETYDGFAERQHKKREKK